MSTGEQPDRNLEQAMDWLLQVRDAPADGTVRARLEGWLAADPDHRRAWEQARRAWQLLGDVPPETARRTEAARPQPSRRRGGAAIAAALAACLALLLLLPAPLQRWQADAVTATAEVRRLALADGSVVHLAPRSALDVRYAADRRTVVLLEGEALFEVAPNPDRPFVVEAAGVETTVLGTAFAVRIADRDVTVAVRSGTVRSRRREPAPPVEATLGPGDRVTIGRTGGPVRERIAPEDVAAWWDGQLFFADATVAEVVEELRRYLPGWVVIADERLAARRVTGLYDLRNPVQALRAAVRPAGGQVTELTPLLHILSMP